MDPLTKEETLQILSFMGVQIPKDTKLPGEVLDKRLQDALNAVQNRDQLPISAPLDPERGQKWPRPPEGESLKKARRGEGRRVLYEDPFLDLRETMMSIGNTIDRGHRWVAIQDRGHENFAISMSPLSTLQVDAGTPGIVVVYRAFNRIADPDAVHRQVAIYKGYRGGNRTVASINASLLELKLMLKLLDMNTALISPHYQPPQTELEAPFYVSILLPIGPLGFREIDRLGNDPGCVVCGNEPKARCWQCQTVSYCSTGKMPTGPRTNKTCLSLKGGKWWTIPLRVCPPGEGGLAKARSGRLDVNHRQRWTEADRRSVWLKEDGLPPPNIHGDRGFLVKFQAPLVVWAHPAFLMYDRQHSFDEVFFYAEDSPEAYAAFMREVQGPRSRPEGGNMYRWARRTGERELTVCFDREPATEVEW
ncbi:hypothetical protein LXA43DRAFT_1093398 [Ganoderma leucocontextum]|nr:hypothetical protein LXA43DRAFT_1093398 [Ganoderma leucocontextum]